MRKILIFLIIFSMVGCINCNREEELDNTPINIPEYVCYALFRDGDDNSMRDYVIVIDMEKDSIIGIHKVGKKAEWVSDFCLRDNKYLYFVYITAGYVRKFDAEKGEIIDELKIPSSAFSIYSIPNDEAFIFQYFKGPGDTAYENSVIDLKDFTYRKKIVGYLGTIAYNGEVFFSPDSEVWIFTGRDKIWKIPHNRMTRFYPGIDTLGEMIEFEDEYNSDRIRVDAIRFKSNDKIYAKCYRVSPTEDACLEHCVVVYSFPSLQILKYISLPVSINVGFGASLITLPNNKIYVSYYICSGYAGHGTDDKYIYVIDGATDEIVKNIDCGLYGPFMMTYSPSLNKVYVFSAYEKKISVIDPNTDEVIKVLVAGEDGMFWGTRIIANK